jgi:hypothetical protein
MTIQEELLNIRSRLNAANREDIHYPVQTRWLIDSIEMNLDDLDRCKPWLDQLKELNKNIL